MKDIINLFNEIGMLAKTPRSGFAFLGSGKQSVAEHCYRMALVAYVLADLSQEKVNVEKLLMICLTHDLAEARTGDLNYVNKKYLQANESKVLIEMRAESRFGEKVAGYIEEYNQKESLESKLAKDADILELLLCLKEELDIGNPRAEAWFKNGCKRLITDTAKELAEQIWRTPSDEWWIKDRDDPHWIHGGKS